MDVAEPRGRRGFSLIELLTVIAIIAVLAALMFPAIVAQRTRARRNACVSNLNQIAGGLRMYRLDNGAYPPALFGFVHGNGQVVMGLYPHWVRSRDEFVCPENPARLQLSTRDTMNMPGQPGGAGIYLTPPLPAPDMVAGRWAVGIAPNPLYPGGIRFPVGDSYDVSFMPTDTYPNNGVWERHYQRQWLPMLDLTRVDPSTAPLMGNTPEERARTYARQLVFRLPDDETLVTTCTYHRNYPDGWRPGQPLPSDSFDVVLFLDGHTEIRPSQQLNQYQDVAGDGNIGWAGWQIKAK